MGDQHGVQVFGASPGHHGTYFLKVSGFNCFCLGNAAFDGAVGLSLMRNHSSTAFAIAPFTVWFVRLFLVGGGADTATVDVFVATDVDEVVSFGFGASPLTERSASWRCDLLDLPRLSRSMLSLAIDYRFFRRRPHLTSATFFASAGLKYSCMVVTVVFGDMITRCGMIYNFG